MVALWAATALIILYIFWQQHGPHRVRGEIDMNWSLALSAEEEHERCDDPELLAKGGPTAHLLSRGRRKVRHSKE